MHTFQKRPKKDVQKLALCYRELQAIIIIRAHQLCKYPINALKGIYDIDGGVIVNNYELRIGENYVIQVDLTRRLDCDKEEQAVANAIDEIFDCVDFSDEQKACDSLMAHAYKNFNTHELRLILDFMTEQTGNPLMRLLQYGGI